MQSVHKHTQRHTPPHKLIQLDQEQNQVVVVTIVVVCFFFLFVVDGTQISLASNSKPNPSIQIYKSGSIRSQFHVFPPEEKWFSSGQLVTAVLKQHRCIIHLVVGKKYSPAIDHTFRREKKKFAPTTHIFSTFSNEFYLFIYFFCCYSPYTCSNFCGDVTFFPSLKQIAMDT